MNTMTQQQEVRKSTGASLSSVIPKKGPRRIPLLTNGPSSEFTAAVSLFAQNVEHLASTRNKRVYLVMGAYPGDGRTTTVANLGIALAMSKHRVVLVDADRRNPSLTAVMQHLRQAGDSRERATDYKNGVALEKIRGLPLYILVPQTVDRVTAGTLVRSLRESFDFVLIDSAPFPGEVDVFRMAAVCDGVIYTIRSRMQNLKLLRQLKEQLDMLDVELVGAVFNQI